MAEVPGAAPPIPPLEPEAPPLAILVDYDGTVALTDVSDTVMAAYVTGAWEAEAAAYDAGLMGSRRLMTIEMAMLDADPTDLLATAAEQPHDPGFVPFVRRAQAAGIRRGRLRRVRVLHRAGAPGARGRGVAGHHGADHVRRPAGRHRLPERAPDVLRVRHLQAPAGARPPGGRPRRRLHRRRRERPPCRGLQRRRVRETTSCGSASRPAWPFQR